MGAPNFACVGVCFLSRGLSRMLTERVIVAHRGALSETIQSFTKTHTHINTHTRTYTHTWVKAFHIHFNQFPLDPLANKLKEPHKVLKRLCCLGSKVRILSCITKIVS